MTSFVVKPSKCGFEFGIANSEYTLSICKRKFGFVVIKNFDESSTPVETEYVYAGKYMAYQFFMNELLYAGLHRLLLDKHKRYVDNLHKMPPKLLDWYRKRNKKYVGRLFFKTLDQTIGQRLTTDETCINKKLYSVLGTSTVYVDRQHLEEMQSYVSMDNFLTNNKWSYFAREHLFRVSEIMDVVVPRESMDVFNQTLDHLPRQLSGNVISRLAWLQRNLNLTQPIIAEKLRIELACKIASYDFLNMTDNAKKACYDILNMDVRKFRRELDNITSMFGVPKLSFRRSSDIANIGHMIITSLFCTGVADRVIDYIASYYANRVYSNVRRKIH